MIMKKLVLFFTLLSIVCAFCVTDLLRCQNSEAAKLGLPEPNQLLKSSDDFSDPVLMGVRLNKDNPLNVDFIVDCADQGNISEQESRKLINQFLVALTVPSTDYWVNLSPYESNRVIADSLAQTQLGQEMLAQDYILKQLSSSLTHPETDLGKEYWRDPVGTQYLEANSKFTKVWIVPGEIEIYEDGDSAFITKSSLELMSEHDYLAGASTGNSQKSALDHILPDLSKEVNSGEHFSNLRQLYRSMILAVWFKSKFRDSFYKHYINKNKLTKEQLRDSELKDKIYKLYCQAFEQGVYDLVKKDDGVRRNYFCGGVAGQGIYKQIKISSSLEVPLSQHAQGPLNTIKTALNSGFAIGQKTTVDYRKERPKDTVDIQGVEAKSNASNDEQSTKENYNPYSNKKGLNLKSRKLDTMGSSINAGDIELVPLGDGEHSNQDQLGGLYDVGKHDDFQEVQIELGQQVKPKVNRVNPRQDYDLNKVLKNADKTVNYLLGILQSYDKSRKIDGESLHTAVEQFIKFNQALVQHNNRLESGVAKGYGVLLGASIASFVVQIEQVLLNTFAARSFAADKYLNDLRASYSELQNNTQQYVKYNGPIVKSSSSVVQGGMDFVGMELTTASSSIPVEIQVIDFNEFNGFDFELISITD